MSGRCSSCCVGTPNRVGSLCTLEARRPDRWYVHLSVACHENALGSGRHRWCVWMNAYLLAFTVAAALSLLLTRLCRDLAVRAAWVDVPDAARKLHAGPVPAIGGVALAASTIGALAFASLVSPWSAAQLHGDLVRVLSLGALGVLMMLVGLVDDLRSLRASR